MVRASVMMAKLSVGAPCQLGTRENKDNLQQHCGPLRVAWAVGLPLHGWGNEIDKALEGPIGTRTLPRSKHLRTALFPV